jgi:hypothetical protein
MYVHNKFISSSAGKKKHMTGLQMSIYSLTLHVNLTAVGGSTHTFFKGL